MKKIIQLSIFNSCIFNLLLLGTLQVNLCFAEHLFIFDFDSTLTKGLRSLARDPILPNIKAGTGAVLRQILHSGNFLSIATFHTSENVIKNYFRAAGLTEEEIQLIKIVVRNKKDLTKDHFKNPYIERIIQHFVEKAPITGMTFYDDNQSNVEEFEKYFNGFFSEGEGIEGILVSKDGEDTFHYLHVNKKLLALPVIKSKVEIEADIEAEHECSQQVKHSSGLEIGKLLKKGIYKIFNHRPNKKFWQEVGKSIWQELEKRKYQEK